MYDWLQRLFSSSNGKAVKPMHAHGAQPSMHPVEQAPAEALPEPDEAVSGMSATAPSATPQQSAISWMQRDDMNANFTHWVFEGGDHSDLFTNKIENGILALLEKTMNSDHSGADMVRRMPGVIPQLLHSLRTETFSGKDLAKKISHDVVLVAAVVRLANSSCYSPDTAITSIEHAVLVLGQSGLRQLITSVAFRPIIDLKSGHFTKLIAPRVWDQSEKCAIACRLLAATEPGIDPFEAFLAGLIQNVGLIVSLRVMDQMSDGSQLLGSASFFNTFTGYARALSCSIAREWKFPASVIKAIEEQGVIQNATLISPLGKILTLGDYLSKMQILIAHDLLHADDARVVKGLSAAAFDCLRTLTDIEDPEADTAKSDPA